MRAVRSCLFFGCVCVWVASNMVAPKMYSTEHKHTHTIIYPRSDSNKSSLFKARAMFYTLRGGISAIRRLFYFRINPNNKYIYIHSQFRLPSHTIYHFGTHKKYTCMLYVLFSNKRRKVGRIARDRDEAHVPRNCERCVREYLGVWDCVCVSSNAGLGMRLLLGMRFIVIIISRQKSGNHLIKGGV